MYDAGGRLIKESGSFKYIEFNHYFGEIIKLIGHITKTNKFPNIFYKYWNYVERVGVDIGCFRFTSARTTKSG